jgi:hypothetical protein
LGLRLNYERRDQKAVGLTMELTVVATLREKMFARLDGILMLVTVLSREVGVTAA